MRRVILLEGEPKAPKEPKIRIRKKAGKTLQGIRNTEYKLLDKDGRIKGSLETNAHGRVMNIADVGAYHNSKKLSYHDDDGDNMRKQGIRHMSHGEVAKVMRHAAADHPHVRFITANRVTGAKPNHPVAFRVNKHKDDVQDRGWRFRPARHLNKGRNKDDLGVRSFHVYHPTAGHIAHAELDYDKTLHLRANHLTNIKDGMTKGVARWKHILAVAKAARRDVPQADHVQVVGSTVKIKKNKLRAGQGSVAVKEMPNRSINSLSVTHPRKKAISAVVRYGAHSVSIDRTHKSKKHRISFGDMRKIYRAVSDHMVKSGLANKRLLARGHSDKTLRIRASKGLTAE